MKICKIQYICVDCGLEKNDRVYGLVYRVFVYRITLRNLPWYNNHPVSTSHKYNKIILSMVIIFILTNTAS